MGEVAPRMDNTAVVEEEDMGSKTPVSILQEMMTRMGTAPKYDLIFDGSGTHTAEFRYKVYANNVSAIGSGRSKKEAKHEAARVALERLSLSQIEDSQPQEEPVEIVTPYKDKIQENAIGELHDMCATNDIPMPEYELVEEKGAPHEKIFTFVCSVSKQKEIGIGRTKKQAKQLAAYSMMNRLKESLADVLTELKEERHIFNERYDQKQDTKIERSGDEQTTTWKKKETALVNV
ncbi:Interferon-inducible double stranded RNA-dependent protein kinase activator A-like protein A [Gryllus bimaculatus]|nr:Interferon-inducible double stranded RNA-dependent protein kinase activator A-like protein A [Gryllus bimaculatus]